MKSMPRVKKSTIPKFDRLDNNVFQALVDIYFFRISEKSICRMIHYFEYPFYSS